MSFIVVIPARYQSGRLPGKPLVNYHQCIKVVPHKHRLLEAADTNPDGYESE